MSRRYMVGLLATVALVTLTSCSEQSDDPGNVSQSSRSLATPNTSAPNVPSIDHPIKAIALQDDPCNALSAEQVQQLGLKSGTHEKLSFGTLCEWEYTDVVGNQVSIGLTTKFDRGLADVYARKNALGFFKKTTVAGYPGAYVDKDDTPSKGFCQLYVGLNGEVAPVVIAQLSGGTDYGRPCQVAAKTAKTMIENLGG